MRSTCDLAWEERGVWRSLGSAFSVRMLRPGSSYCCMAPQRCEPTSTRREHQKKGGDQALGRSRGGLSTKIHAATIDENCSVALHLTAGHAHDGRQFESLYESLDPENVLESAIMDKGYDEDRIRERLSYDGVQAVIPPIPTRARKLPYDHARYRQRNRIERFYN